MSNEAKTEEKLKLQYMVIIAGRNLKDRLLTAMSEKKCHVINIIYGKGAVNAGFLMDALGLTHEENKILVTCLLLNNKADDVFKMLTDEFQFDKPNTGIAFVVPVENLLY